MRVHTVSDARRYSIQGTGVSGGQQHGQSIVPISVHIGTKKFAPQFGQDTSINGIRSIERSLLLSIKTFPSRDYYSDIT